MFRSIEIVPPSSDPDTATTTAVWFVRGGWFLVTRAGDVIAPADLDLELPEPFRHRN